MIKDMFTGAGFIPGAIIAGVPLGVAGGLILHQLALVKAFEDAAIANSAELCKTLERPFTHVKFDFQQGDNGSCILTVETDDGPRRFMIEGGANLASHQSLDQQDPLSPDGPSGVE